MSRATPIISLAIVLSGLVVGDALFAWTAPAAVPPAGNVPAPLHTGATGQVKSGGLSLNTLMVLGQTMVGYDPTPEANLLLDVNGRVGASEYCDQNGQNCSSSVGGGGIARSFAMGTWSGGQLRHSANVASVVQSGTAWVVTLSSPPTGDTSYTILANVASNAQASVYAANPTQFVVQARSSNLNNFLAPNFSFVVFVPN